MRNEILNWTDSFPAYPSSDGSFKGSPLHKLIGEASKAIAKTLPELGYMVVEGSVGQLDWTHTPWVAVMDPRITSTVRDGYFLVYMLSHGKKRLYLSLAQGCSLLKEELGQKGAWAELTRRAKILRDRAAPKSPMLTPEGMVLDSKSWRAKLYEAGTAFSIQYDPKHLPTEDVLIDHLRDALELYRDLEGQGGWHSVDDILQDSEYDLGTVNIVQAKRYQQHKRIERQSWHSQKVKRVHGYTCMACKVPMKDRYGSVAESLIDAHHLIPLSSLADLSAVTFDAKKDFAVLCPNCHRVIHRLDDPSDLEALRALVQSHIESATL